jgi:hypothetical protein
MAKPLSFLTFVRSCSLERERRRGGGEAERPGGRGGAEQSGGTESAERWSHHTVVPPENVVRFTAPHIRPARKSFSLARLRLNPAAKDVLSCGLW